MNIINKVLVSLNKCEIYNQSDNEWEEAAPMQMSRSNSASCIYEKKFIYVFGGNVYNKNTNRVDMIDSIEKYNIELNFWISIDLRMPFPMSD